MGYQGKQKAGDAWSPLLRDQCDCQPSVLHGAAKETLQWLPSSGVIIPMCDTVMLISTWPCAPITPAWNGSPWEAVLGWGLGRGCTVPPAPGARETSFPLQGRHGEGCTCRKPQHFCLWCACLDAAKQEMLFSSILCS